MTIHQGPGGSFIALSLHQIGVHVIMSRGGSLFDNL